MSALSEYLSERARVDGLSIRGFASRCGISQTTAHRLLHGTAVPDAETLEKVAAKLPAPLNKLVELVGVLRPEPFLLPSYADQLSRDERAMVKHVIRTVLASSGRLPASDGEAVEAPSEDATVTELRVGTPKRDRARVRRAAHKRTADTDGDNQ